MLSAVVTVLLVLVMMLIVASLVISAWRECRRHKRQRAAQSMTTALLQLRNGFVVSIEKPVAEQPPIFTLPPSWYARRRTLVSLGFLVMIFLTLLTQGGLAGGTLENLSRGISFTFLRYSQATDLHLASHVQAPAVVSNASTRLVRIDSASAAQYYTAYQLNVWSYSSCSGIAMEMVMNAYGRHYIAADVLQVEQKLGVWDEHEGLLRNEGIAMTADSFGFRADVSTSRSLNDLIAISNGGKPIIVNVRASYYYPYGHFFVVRGGDSQYMYIADSSPANFQRMSHAMFAGMWTGYSAVLTPKA